MQTKPEARQKINETATIRENGDVRNNEPINTFHFFGRAVTK